MSYENGEYRPQGARRGAEAVEPVVREGEGEERAPEGVTEPQEGVSVDAALPRVTVLDFTPDPMALVGRCAGVCYGKADAKPERARNCYLHGHMSVFEHAKATFLVEGVSRACQNQVVRHRLAAYSVESQRYCKLDGGSDWYMEPEAVVSDPGLRAAYEAHMEAGARLYADLVEGGVRPEDARFVLPNAARTTMAVTMDLRELDHFCKVRMDPHAQWEVRWLAGAMLDAYSACDEGCAEFAALVRDSIGG